MVALYIHDVICRENPLGGVLVFDEQFVLILLLHGAAFGQLAVELLKIHLAVAILHGDELGVQGDALQGEVLIDREGLAVNLDSLYEAL